MLENIWILTAPSEWKNLRNKFDSESLTFDFEKPLDIAKKATEKDLKCSWKRFEEGISLNKNIDSSWTIEAINRYSWVVFNAIWYQDLTDDEKAFINDNLYILSWMYGIVKPLDKIGNYKLPIETKWLLPFWKGKLTDELNKQNKTIWINLLPKSYAKMLDFSLLAWNVVEVKFIKDWKSLTHWVKKHRGEFIKRLSMWEEFNFSWGEVVIEV